MDTHVKQTEPYSPQQNVAKLTICELKKGARCEAAQAKSPNKLWDHALELESYVHSNMVIARPELNGQVPETIMSGQTTNISHFAKFAWDDWIKFYDILTGYPEPRKSLDNGSDKQDAEVQ